MSMNSSVHENYCDEVETIRNSIYSILAKIRKNPPANKNELEDRLKALSDSLRAVEQILPEAYFL